MVVERINYYDEELGHRWTSVDFRLGKENDAGILWELVPGVEGEWSTLPKHSDLREVVKKYGGDDHHKVY